MNKKNKKKYPMAVVEDAINRVIYKNNIKLTAREMDISYTTLYQWVKKYRVWVDGKYQFVDPERKSRMRSLVQLNADVEGIDRKLVKASKLKTEVETLWERLFALENELDLLRRFRDKAIKELITAKGANVEIKNRLADLEASNKPE